jgi:hypothetical protein
VAPQAMTSLELRRPVINDESNLKGSTLGEVKELA